MDVGTVLSVVQTLFSAFENPKLKEVLSIFGYKSQLVELQDTVETIEAVLRDAETKQELSHQDQLWIEKLKDAVFEADDLFDEFVTLAEQKQLLEADSSLSQKVSSFFSRSKNPVSLAYRMSRGVKDMRYKLKTIAENSQFISKIDPEPIKKRSRETCSYVNEVEIIGREHELESIVSTLLTSSNDQSDLSTFSIVGIGGLGKTALAQLVYNDPRVKDAFPLRLWTCISDQDQKELDVKNILARIVGENQEGSTLVQVRRKLQVELANKKCLLVLDDVWTEKRDQWCKLADHLNGGERGSWIVVTTRSKRTATITGGLIHDLLGLSKADSWLLFEKMAFDLQSSLPDDELVSIGQKIVDGCAQVPLAIRVAGTLLYGQDKSKWRSVQKIGLANVRDDDNGIMPILKLSFHHLESPLKNCFQYCALFPKDYRINKRLLISLWMAQGYIVPLDKFQSIEDVGEEYFSILSRRCFFQDIEQDEFGNIRSCKIHDLMHDTAQNVAGKEICAVDTVSGNVDKNVRHLSLSNKSQYEKYYSLGKIRTLLHFQYHIDNSALTVEAIVGSFQCLRMLDLSYGNIKRLPNSIGELLHLRGLDLSGNVDMEVLPKSITKLYNLQTLRLLGCRKLKELPKDLGRLVKLRLLDIECCNELGWMPRGMGKLTYLHTLGGGYRVGGRGRCTSWKQWFDGLDDLKTLNNIKGELVMVIWWPKNAKDNVVTKDSVREAFYLKHMEHLDSIFLLFSDEEHSNRAEDEGMKMKLMEALQPHSNLKRLTVAGYDGVKMPGWVNLLPNVVSLSLLDCEDLKYLRCLGNLCHLKTLCLHRLLNLEYIEQENTSFLATTVEKVSFFPSFEQLHLVYLPKLKGWRRGLLSVEETSDNSSNNPLLQTRRCLPHLKVLTIINCQEFEPVLTCPRLETLHLCSFSKRLQICSTKSSKTENEDNESSGSILVPNLRELTLNNGAWLNPLLIESISHSLQTLSISDDDEMVELPNYIQHLSALQSLKIECCKLLKAMPSWMPKLISLSDLSVRSCSEKLMKRCRKDPPGEDWPYIQHIPNITLA